MMKTETSYDVFLSHNSIDKPSVEIIARRLEDEERLRPWLDKWNLIPGEPWQEAVEQALDASRTCAVFLGAGGIGPWENEEMRIALSHRVERDGFRVIPVLLPGASLPEQGKLPRFLSRLTWVDFRRGLANQAAFRRLVAGIRGFAPGHNDNATLQSSVIECPYRGLEVFEEAHAKFFFGRESLSQHIIEGLLHHRLVIVLGSSGCGKSSLVRAGVIPQLKSSKLAQSETWTYVTLRPGEHPLTALAESLVSIDPTRKSLGSELSLLKELESDKRALYLYIGLCLSDQPKGTLCLLFIDQFEEMITLCKDDKERDQFLLNLRYASTISDGRVVTIVAMRADFMNRAAEQRYLAEMLSAHQFVVSPMDDADLRRAIEEPAVLVGLGFENTLVELILEEVDHEPGALPLLEDTLTQLHEHRSAGNIASLRTYQELGGVHGALAKRAEKVFEGFSFEEKDIVRRVFLRLTQPNEGVADTRRQAELSELWPDAAHQPIVVKVVERLVESRLLTMSRDPKGAQMVDVAHEALIRGWPRLRNWVEEEHESLRIHREITDATRKWRTHNRDAGLLYRSVQLTEAIQWKRKSDPSLNEPEREFLDTSYEAQQREKRAAQIRRWTAVIALVIILILGVLALRQYQTQRIAQQGQQAAQEEQKAARLQALISGVMQFKSTNPELSLQLAMEVTNLSRTEDVESALRQALDGFPEAVALRGHEGMVWSLDYSKQGTERIVTAGADGTARIWDVNSGRELHRLFGHDGKDVNRAIFSPDGTKVLTAGADGTACIWDAELGKVLHKLSDHEGEVLDAAFSADGKRAVTVDSGEYNGENYVPGMARVWDVESGNKLLTLSGHANSVNKVAFNPDGKTLVTAGDDKTARIWDAESGKELHKLSGHTNAVIRLAYSLHGEFIATASKDKTVRIWNAHTGDLLHVLSGHGGIINSVDFSPNVQKVVTASDDTSARIWDVKTGRTLPVLLGHSGFIYRAAFSPDGKCVVTASADKTVRLWDAATGQALSVLQGSDTENLYAAFSPDGKHIAAVGSGAAWIWKVSTNQPIRRIQGHDDEIWSIAYSPDGKYVATGSGNEGSLDNTARIWDTETGQELRKFTGYKDRINSVAFSPDGSYLIMACFHDEARIWDVRDTKKPAIVLEGYEGSVWGAAFSLDGSKVITGHRDKIARIWNAHTGQLLQQLRGHEKTVRSVAFSTDGKYAVTASEDGMARIWDIQAGNPVLDKPLFTLSVRGGPMSSAAFSPNGKYVVTASTDRTARIWDAQTGKELQVLKGHIGSVTSAAFSPDGKYVVTASRDHSVRLWDVYTGQQFSLLRGHSDIVRSAAFSPDGKNVVTAGTDRIVRIYACEECVSLDDLLELAKSRHLRKLSSDDRIKYHLEK